MIRLLTGDDGGAGGEIHEEGRHEEAVVDVSLPFVLYILAVGITVRFLQRKLPIAPPFTIAVFIITFCTAAWAGSDRLGNLGDSIRSWQVVHPHVILFVLLPPLLFESAFKMDFHVFRRVVWSSILLAVPGVAVSVCLTAVIAKAVFPYDWDWNTSFLIGSILSATDPVAVVAVLNTLGAKKKLSTLVEGESLLNDGSAFVLFLIFLDAVRGEDLPFGELVERFAQLSLGGPAWGLLTGLVLYGFLTLVWNDPLIEVTAVILAVFATFFVAEDVLHVSGVLAVVTLGLLFAQSGKYAISRTVEHMHHVVWEHVAFFANTMIFGLSGAIIFSTLIKDEGSVGRDASNWGYLFAMYGLLHVVRVITIAVLSPVLSHLGYGFNWKEGAILTMGALRGAVGLALGLLVSEELTDDEELVELLNFHVAGIVTLTLLINGTITGKVYQFLQVYPENRFHKDFVCHAMSSLQHTSSEVLEHTAKEWFFRHANYDLVRRLLPPFTKLEYENGHLHGGLPPLSAVFSKAKAKGMWRNMKSVIMASASMRTPALSDAAAAAGDSDEYSDGDLASLDGVQMRDVSSPERGATFGSAKFADAARAAVAVEREAGAGAERKPSPTTPRDDTTTAGAGVGAGAGAGAAAGAGDGDGTGDGSADEGGNEGASEAPHNSTPRRPPVRRNISMRDLVSQLMPESSSCSAGEDQPGAASTSAPATNTGPRTSRPPLRRQMSVFAPPSKLKRGFTSRHMQEDEALQRVFSSLRAAYLDMYERRDIGQASILVLNESVDSACEYDLYFKAHPKEPEGSCRSTCGLHPLVAEWEVIVMGCAKQLPTRLAQRYARGHRSCGRVFDPMHFVEAMNFNQVRFEIETLRAFVLAHSGSMPTPGDKEYMGEKVYKSLANRMAFSVSTALHALHKIKQKHTGIMTIVRSSLAARHALAEMRERIVEVHLRRGLLDATVTQDLLLLVDQRLHDLESYHPSVSILRTVEHHDRVLRSDSSRDMEDQEVARVMEACEARRKELHAMPQDSASITIAQAAAAHQDGAEPNVTAT